MAMEIETAAEGAQFEERQLPVDILYSRLTEWLVDRKKIPLDWRKRLSPIHARIAKELQTLPREVDPWLLSLSSENTAYMEALRVRDILAKANPEARTLFGGLAGAAGSWDVIVRAYTKDSVFLGEAAQVLVQYTNYEIPHLRQQVAKVQQQLADLERREAEYRRNAATSAQKYKQACQELGIAGLNVRQELKALQKQLPDVFRTFVECVCGDEVGEASSYYKAFVEYAHSEDKREDVVVLPALMDLRANPPTTEFGALPEDDVGVEDFSRNLTEMSGESNMQIGESGAEAPAINWNIDLGGETECGELEAGGEGEWRAREEGERVSEAESRATEGEIRKEVGESELSISWDIGAVDLSDQTGTATEINWDLGMIPGESLSGISEGGGGLGINWDIEIASGEDGAEGNGPLQINWDVDLSGVEGEVSEVEGQEGESVGGRERVKEEIIISPLVDTEYRNRVLDDLFELRAFLRQRISEMGREESSALQSQLLAGAPPIVQQHGLDSLGAMEAALGKTIEIMTSKKTRDLLLILTSPRFVERLAESLEQKRGQEVKLTEGLKGLQGKRLELRNSLSATWPKQEAAIKRTREVKALVEETLKKGYDGRPVNIIGEINNLLGA